MDLKRLIKYLIGLFLFIAGLTTLIFGLSISNTLMIVPGFFGLVGGAIIILFIYMSPE
jgi:hypothetical protein